VVAVGDEVRPADLVGLDRRHVPVRNAERRLASRCRDAARRGVKFRSKSCCDRASDDPDDLDRTNAA